jgi:uncharacterized protein
MTVSLYAATVPRFLQIIGSVAALVDKGEAHAAEAGGSPADVLGARLAPDMLPFAYQVKSVAEHSAGAVEGVRAGLFSPSLAPPPDSFEALRAKLSGARAALKALDPAEVDGWAGRDMTFAMRDMRLDFTAEDFLLSFSMPNFYFHATTAYGILRARGVKLGKPDFLGRLPLKG